jgi:Uncharacterized conserved protein
MTVTDTTAPAQREAISLEFDLRHPPEKVWRALTDPALLAEWLLPAIDLKLEPGAAFTLKTQPHPGLGRAPSTASSSRSSRCGSSATPGAFPSWTPS